jgi:hypothetical protein
VSIKEHISRVLWNSNTFDFCRFVAYCGTKYKNRGYETLLMTGSLIFPIKAIKRLPEAAIHTPIRFLQFHEDFLNSNYSSFVLRPKKKN